MGTIAQWLGAIAWPIITRILSSAGIGIVTYVGADMALRSALDQVKAALGGLTGEAVNFLAMCGIFEAMGIMAGGMVACLAFGVFKKFSLRTGT